MRILTLALVGVLALTAPIAVLGFTGIEHRTGDRSGAERDAGGGRPRLELAPNA